MKSQTRKPLPISQEGLIRYPGVPIREILTFGLLPSELKVWLYRKRGWKIGNNVKIGVGSIIAGRDVRVDDEVNVGALSIIRGKEIKLSRGVDVGRRTILAVPTILVGEDARIDDMVWISAGMERPESAIRLGAFSMLMRHSYVNCTMEVSIGEGTGIGGYCLIFTHGHWLSWLDGYPRQLAPVSIGRDVWLPWRVFVMPGSVVGQGSVIGADSTVAGVIPPFSLAAGCPAKVIKTLTARLPTDEMYLRLQIILSDFISVLEYKGVRIDGQRIFDLNGRSGIIRLVAPNEALPNAQDVTSGDTVVSMLPLPIEWRKQAQDAKLPWFDIPSKERSDYQNAVGHELNNFLAAYGVRPRRV